MCSNITPVRAEVAEANKRDWKEYNQKLISRGAICIDKACLKDWGKELKAMNKGKEGHSYEYPNSFIQFIGILKQKLLFPYRKLQGFLKSFFQFFQVPNYTTVFRRMNTLDLGIAKSIPKNDEPLFISIDASGLKADNGGSWLEKRFGRKKRKWIKIHFAVDVKSKRIIELSVTTDKTGDNKRFRGLVRRACKRHPIGRVAADPAYDDFRNYELLHKKGIRPAIKPKGNSNPLRVVLPADRRKLYRLKQVLLFHKYKYKTWKQKTGYNFRTISESVFSAFKRNFEDAVSSKKFCYVKKEVMWKAFAYNLMV